MKKLSEMLKENGVPSATGTDGEPLERYYKNLCEMYNRQEGNLHLQDGYNCPICKNKGFIAKAEKTEFGYWTEIKYFCKCQSMRNTIRQMEKSGLKSLISKYTMASYTTTEDWQKNVHQKANDFVKQHLEKTGDNWFYIGGASGAGKTHICTAICREFLLKGLAVRYMLWRDDAVKLKANLTEYAEYDGLMNELKHVDVLYIDDLFKSGYTGESGKQKPTAADINLAFELLNYRYNNPELITILSSECTMNDLLAIDEAIGGRIAERAGRFMINLTADGNKNYRTKNQIGV